VLERLISDGALPAGYAAEDDAAIHLTGGEISCVLSQKPGKTVYAVRAENGAFVREPLEARNIS